MYYNGEKIDPAYGVPVKHISCPGCGKRYNKTVCKNCQECSKCCGCNEQKLIPADEFIKMIL